MTQPEPQSGENQPGIFAWFFRSEASGSLVLLVCTVVALGWANSAWAEHYFQLAHTQIGISWNGWIFDLSLQHWINDALMVVFFFVVGLEIKREILVGQLSSLRLAILPVAAAVGGMLVPAALYSMQNFGGEGAPGWGVPMATDIAFALGILALLGKRVPIGLKVFLAALAIADDLGAVLVIALFYTETIRWAALAVAACFLWLIVLAIRLGTRRIGLYALLCGGVWVAFMASGVHTTVSGILVAFLVPIRARSDPDHFLARTRKRIGELAESQLTRESMLDDRAQLDALDEIYLATEEMQPAGLKMEHRLHPVQAWVILPLFALFNAGVVLDTEAAGALLKPISVGMLLGLVLGKQVGVFLFSWLAVRAGWAGLPDGVTWAQIYGVSCLAGIGFTMSLFISDLAFSDALLVSEAKIGILAASLIAGVWGVLVLWRVLPHKAT